MKIDQVDLIDGARKARGLTVVIDVFRAFSVACYCMNNGAENMIPAGSVKDALEIAGKTESSVLIGEREGKKLSGFDYGNSPTEVIDVDFSGKTIVQTTHAGTQGIIHVQHADEILTGAFVNAKATAAYIQRKKPERVTLVKMGLRAESPSDEDDLCADYIEALLKGEYMDQSEMVETLRKSPFSQRFFDTEKPWNPERDFELCLDIDRFDFALRVRRDGHRILGLDRVYQ